MSVILSVENLKKYFPVEQTFLDRLLGRRKEYVKAVDGVSFEIKRGETLALVGESGCGKTTTGRLVVRLLKPTGGKIVFDGIDITFTKESELRKWFRRKAQIIFQDPYASLNPKMKIGEAIEDPLLIHFGDKLSKKERKEEVLKIMSKVGLVPPEYFYDRYPHELSGGQRQRAVIARALVLRPEFIVADEPTSSLDVSIRAQILKLLQTLKEEFKLTFLFITHDLATAYYIADRIAVMYLGKIVEVGDAKKVILNPAHIYTRALFSAVPLPDPKLNRSRSKIKIRSEPPNPINIPSGCRFHPRCPYAEERCRRQNPPLIKIDEKHFTACWLYS
ncbi:MAG TPA: ABC transporter ATP-binding protein [Thermoprotei archaeon]|nr:ABC transporter ATP-binding protein [Thermoprotei archaeon]